MPPASNSRARKWLAGCGISLLAFVVLAVVVSIAGYLWISTPGPQVDTEWFIGAETVGVFHLDRTFEDEGVLELFDSLAEQMQQRQQEHIGSNPSLRAILGQIFRPGRREAELNNLKRDAPRQLTLILETVPGAAHPEAALAVNLSRFPRLFRLGISLFGTFSDRAEHFRNFTLLPVEEGAVTSVQDTLLWSHDRAALRQILQRLDRLPSDPEKRSLHPPGEGFSDPRWDVYGRLENRGDAMRYLLELWDDKKLKLEIPRLAPSLANQVESLESIDVGLDLQKGDRALADLRLNCKTAAACSTWKDLLELNLNGVGSGEAGTGPPPRRLDLVGSTLSGEFQLTGIQAAVKDFLLGMIPAEAPEEKSP